MGYENVRYRKIYHQEPNISEYSLCELQARGRSSSQPNKLSQIRMSNRPCIPSYGGVNLQGYNTCFWRISEILVYNYLNMKNAMRTSSWPNFLQLIPFLKQFSYSLCCARLIVQVMLLTDPVIGVRSELGSSVSVLLRTIKQSFRGSLSQSMQQSSHQSLRRTA